MSTHQSAGLADQVWLAVWGWLERHDSLTGALVSVGLGGLISWVMWRARKVRLELEARQKLDAEWRASVNTRLSAAMTRAEVVEMISLSVADRDQKITELRRSMERAEARTEQRFREQAALRAEHLALVRGDISKLSQQIDLLTSRALDRGKRSGGG